MSPYVSCSLTYVFRLIVVSRIIVTAVRISPLSCVYSRQRLRLILVDLESFKILSVYALPMQTKSIRVFVSPTRNHDPLLLVPDGKEIRIFNISHFTPRPPPEFPLYNKVHLDASPNDGLPDEDSQLADALSQNLHVGEAASSEPQDEDGDDIPAAVTYARPRPERKLFDEVPSWVVNTQAADEVHDRLPDVDSCEMAWGGEAIIGIGKKGTFFHWKLRHSPTNP